MQRKGISVSRQRGWSLWSMLSTLVTVLVLGTLAVRLLPVYVDHNMVITVSRSIMDSRDTANLSQGQFRREVSRSLRMNNISDVDPDSVTLVRAGGDLSVRINYERRVPLFRNIELLVSFDDRVE